MNAKEAGGISNAAENRIRAEAQKSIGEIVARIDADIRFAAEVADRSIVIKSRQIPNSWFIRQRLVTHYSDLGFDTKDLGGDIAIRW